MFLAYDAVPRPLDVKDSVAGVEFLDKDIHLFSAIEMESSPLDVVVSGGIDC